MTEKTKIAPLVLDHKHVPCVQFTSRTRFNWVATDHGKLPFSLLMTGDGFEVHRALGVNDLTDIRRWINQALADTPMCAYCDETKGLRKLHDMPQGIPQDYICECCFTPTDDGPGFDDLAPADAAE